MAQFPIRIPHALLPPPFFRHAFYLFLSLSSPSLYPALSPFSLPPLLNLGTWIQPRKNLANLDVRTCILMCIIYVEKITEDYVKHGSTVTISALDISKVFLDRYARLNSVNR